MTLRFRKPEVLSRPARHVPCSMAEELHILVRRLRRYTLVKATRMEARTDSETPFFAFSMIFEDAVFCDFRIC